MYFYRYTFLTQHIQNLYFLCVQVEISPLVSYAGEGLELYRGRTLALPVTVDKVSTVQYSTVQYSTDLILFYDY